MRQMQEGMDRWCRLVVSQTSVEELSFRLEGGGRSKERAKKRKQQ